MSPSPVADGGYSGYSESPSGRVSAPSAFTVHEVMEVVGSWLLDD
jgi:hypothetical protein